MSHGKLEKGNEKLRDEANSSNAHATEYIVTVIKFAHLCRGAKVNWNFINFFDFNFDVNAIHLVSHRSSGKGKRIAEAGGAESRN